MALFGLDIVIPWDGDPDPTLPYADDDDALLVPGSLILLDPGHSAAPWAAVPGNGAAVHNLAWKHARDAAGAGDAAAFALPFSDLHRAEDAIFEMTPKRGFHRLYSRTGNTQGNRGAHFDLPPALEAYIFANLGHAYYLSCWSTTTRTALAGGVVDMSVLLNGYSTNNYIVGTQDGLVQPGPGAANALGSRLDPAGSVLGNRFRSVAARGTTGVAPASAADLSGPFALAGNGSLFAGLATGKCGSSILYRLYLEDLTRSGRSYALVDAIDSALWTAAFTGGGRYAGDAWTDPATFP